MTAEEYAPEAESVNSSRVTMRERICKWRMTHPNVPTRSRPVTAMIMGGRVAGFAVALTWPHQSLASTGTVLFLARDSH